MLGLVKSGVAFFSVPICKNANAQTPRKIMSSKSNSKSNTYLVKSMRSRLKRRKDEVVVQDDHEIFGMNPWRCHDKFVLKYLSATRHEIFEFMTALPKEERCFYEKVRPNEPCVPYGDIEFKVDGTMEDNDALLEESSKIAIHLRE